MMISTFVGQVRRVDYVANLETKGIRFHITNDSNEMTYIANGHSVKVEAIRDLGVYRKETFVRYRDMVDICGCVLLREGEEVFIDELGEITTITRVVKATSGNLTYYTEHIIDIIEDEETEKSLLEAKKLNLERDENSKKEEKEKVNPKMNCLKRFIKRRLLK